MANEYYQALSTSSLTCLMNRFTERTKKKCIIPKSEKCHFHFVVYCRLAAKEVDLEYALMYYLYALQVHEKLEIYLSMKKILAKHNVTLSYKDIYIELLLNIARLSKKKSYYLALVCVSSDDMYMFKHFLDLAMLEKDAKIYRLIATHVEEKQHKLIFYAKAAKEGCKKSTKQLIDLVVPQFFEYPKFLLIGVNNYNRKAIVYANLYLLGTNMSNKFDINYAIKMEQFLYPKNRNLLNGYLLEYLHNNKNISTTLSTVLCRMSCTNCANQRICMFLQCSHPICKWCYADDIHQIRRAQCSICK